MVRFNTRVISTVGTLFLSTTIATASTSNALQERTDTQPCAGFRATDGSVSFALNIPQNDTNNDLYFTISGSSTQSWIAIGMGNDQMEDSLIFMVYTDSTGKSITISPRLSYGHVEPTYTPLVNTTLLAGSSISTERYTANVLCHNCQTWRGAKNQNLFTDHTSTAAKFIFAAGPSGALNTDDKGASVKRHASYGAFTMDLNDAYGKAGIPIIQYADMKGTVQTQDKDDHDFSSVLHGCVMILAFVGLMPFGILILRLLESPKWHAVNQGVSAGIAVLGAVGGVYIGTVYNRTRSCNSTHQIIGLIVILMVIGQFILGYLHHRIYKRTFSPTKLAKPHIWIGRIIIPLGITNGFLGFPLALNPHLDWALLAVVLVVLFALAPFAWWAWRKSERNKRAGIGNDGYGGNVPRQRGEWQTEIVNGMGAAASRSDVHLTSYGENHQRSYPGGERF